MKKIRTKKQVTKKDLSKNSRSLILDLKKQLDKVHTNEQLEFLLLGITKQVLKTQVKIAIDQM